MSLHGEPNRTIGGAMTPAGAALELSPGESAQSSADRMAAVTARAARATSAMIHIADGSHLRLIGGHALPAGFLRREPVPVSSTLAGLVLQSGFPVVISDTHTDIRVPMDAPVRSTAVRCYAGFPVRDPSGLIVGVCAAMDDQCRDWSPEELAGVDDAAQACTAFVAEHLALVREHHQRVFLDTLLDSLDTGVAACDAGGRMVLVNRSLQERLGTDPVESTAADWAARLPITDVDGTPVGAAQTSLVRALHGETVRGTEHRLHLHGERRLFRINGHPMVGDDGQRLGAVAVFHDITAAHRADRLQQLLNRTRDDYLNMVGHELRTPVSIVLSYLDLMRDTDPNAPAGQLQPLIDAARRGGERLRRLVEDLLDLSALDAGRRPLTLTDVELGSVITDGARRFAERAGDKDIALTCQVPRPAPQRADRCRIGQVIAALLDNAIAYTPPGGAVTVSLRQTEAATHLTVSDNGYGIPAHELPHVFERFFRGAIVTDLAIPGTGLGLTLARLIVERHHGTITVTPNPDVPHGTTARVRLPRDAPAAPA